MKNYTLFVVAAILFSLVGCTTQPVDTILDPKSDKIVLMVDIANPHTKVALGDRDQAGKYPAYWSDGDKISVNGYVSEPVLIDSENPSRAQFEIECSSLEYPYNILYPASTDGTVSFAALQNYVKGTFESGTTPMYASAERGEQIQLNHLSGVLRFSFNGAVTLKEMTVTAAQGAIAGKFRVDFANGSLTPTDEVFSTLEYSFGEGLALSADKNEEFFLVMPCGDFGLCTIELKSTDGKMMSLKLDTGKSPIKARVVREFKPITFKAGTYYELPTLDVEEDEFDIDYSMYAKCPSVDGEYIVINEASELMWLFYNEHKIDGVTYSKIRIGADINMGAFKYIPMPAMNLADGAEIDGNNKTIKGVTMDEEATAIFGDVNSLNIHDLTLTDCSVNTAVQTGAGILVGEVSTGLTVNNVTFNNCSVVAPRMIGLVAGALHTGTFNISNVVANGGLVETSYVSGKSGLAGGLVGCFAKNGDGATTSTATFTNCTVSTKVKSYMEATNYFYGKIVGQMGSYNGDEKLYFVNCNGAEATLVPMYDQGTKNAETAVLSFCEARRADFCQTTLTAATDNLLGGERYCRGEVYYDGNRFVPEWDGKRAATMITSVDGDITTYYVYSAFDLAKAQGASFNSSKKLVLKTDVDMGGHLFNPIYYVRNLDGENHSIYNVKVNYTQSEANYGAGLISAATSTTTHQNLTIVGADIACYHDASLPALEYGNDDDGAAGNAYAGALLSRVKSGTYTASNVHVRNSEVRGVCKVGGLIGTVTATTATIDNCSVEGSIVENYDPKVVNYYKMETKSSSMVIDGLQWWYTAGECGGLIGFVAAKSATISNCSVKSTQINCTGQPNKDVVANIWDESKWTAGVYSSGVSIKGNATTTIAGRHINQFIGDLRSQRTETQQKEGTGEYTTTISNYTVSGNSYNGVSADSTNNYNHEYASGQYCPVVGCAYYTGVDVNVIINIHVSHCAGTLNFNAVGGEATTLTEAIGSGNNMSWFGGSSKNVTIGILSNKGTSYYPAAPTE